MKTSSSEFLVAWSQIIVRSDKTSSLKFALACSLIDFARKHDLGSIHITRMELARNFLEYYWLQVVEFKLRQAATIIQEPLVVRQIRDIAELISKPGVLKTAQKRRRAWNNIDDIEEHLIEPIVVTLAQRGFREVVPRFHHVRGPAGKQNTDELFFKTRTNAIVIPDEARSFLVSYAPVLQATVLHQWALWLEKFNTSPKITSKLTFRRDAPRTSLRRFREVLQPVQQRCFYCGEPFEDAPQVDHFIPWSYLVEDELWNLVLACQLCNRGKLNILPDEDYVRALSTRNQEALVSESRIRSMMQESILRFPGDERSMEAIIRRLWDQAARDGFTKGWKPVARRS